jgi:hypothetical protein
MPALGCGIVVSGWLWPGGEWVVMGVCSLSSRREANWSGDINGQAGCFSAEQLADGAVGPSATRPGDGSSGQGGRRGSATVYPMLEGDELVKQRGKFTPKHSYFKERTHTCRVGCFRISVVS